MARGNGQMAHIVQESKEWTYNHSFKDVQTIQDAARIGLAGQDYMVERLTQKLCYPMWGVATGLLVNAGLQAAKWLLGL